MASVKFKVLPVHHFNTDDPRLKNANVIPIPEIFIKGFASHMPYNVWYGSRYSAKSWTKAAQYLLEACQDNYFRAVYARMTQKAARLSQFQLFKDLMRRYPLLGDQFTVREHDMRITHKRNGNFLIGGSFEDSESLMSVPDITHFWCEEPINRRKSLVRKQFLDIAGTLRNSEGILPQFDFTFNPISPDNFIYEDIFRDKVYRANIIKANYYDNPYCPPDRVEFLENMKLTNNDRYQVDGLGKWGSVATGFEYYGMYSDGAHDKKAKIHALPIHITFDFNVIPYMTAIVNQIFFHEVHGLIVFQAIKEYTPKPPYSTIKYTCDQVLTDWEGHIKKHGCFVYGDPAGKARSVREANENSYDDIIKHMRGYVGHSNLRLNTSARRHLSTDGKLGRFELFQKLFGGELHAVYQIDSTGCPLLTQDYKNVQIGPNGEKLKQKVSENGIKFEKYGHTSDAQDYFIGWQVKYQIGI